jgi:hypothetical protein
VATDMWHYDDLGLEAERPGEEARMHLRGDLREPEPLDPPPTREGR